MFTFVHSAENKEIFHDFAFFWNKKKKIKTDFIPTLVSILVYGKLEFKTEILCLWKHISLLLTVIKQKQKKN